MKGEWTAMPFTVRFRSGTDIEWGDANPKLERFELARNEDGRFKVGDGATHWLDLPYSTELPERIVLPSYSRRTYGDWVRDWLRK